MAVRSIDQILGELNSVYNPQIDLIRKQQGQIPQQIADEERGLQAKQTQAFGDILGGARRRGLGFAGIPLQEQAKYTSTEFLPALARLKQQGRQQAMSLEEALLGINERRNQQAQQLRRYDVEDDRWERQFNEERTRYQQQLAAARRAAGGGGGGGIMPSLGGLGGGKPTMTRKKDGGFSFTDPNGNPVSAAAYALGTGVPFRQLLQDMANQGDTGAKRALGFVGDDFGYDTKKIRPGVTSPQLLNLYKALTWGLK